MSTWFQNIVIDKKLQLDIPGKTYIYKNLTMLH